MMKKSVDGLYEERKHTIRFFLCGLGSLLIAGMMFGLTALRSPARICVVMVFALNLVGTAMYMLHITRPKFRVPKGMRIIMSITMKLTITVHISLPSFEN